MAKDYFQSTLNTWIDRHLALGERGRAEVNRHIMETYAEPLRIYCLGAGSRSLGEPEDVVQGFFASRLDRDSFFQQWRASEKPLRRWLMNAFCFYLMEMRKECRRGAMNTPEVSDEPATATGDPEAAFEKAAATSFVRQAIDHAAQECVSGGLTDHWEVFVLHHIAGRPYSELSAQFNITSARAAVMARTAGRKFQAALCEVLLRDGVDETELDDEIDRLLETTS